MLRQHTFYFICVVCFLSVFIYWNYWQGFGRVNLYIFYTTPFLGSYLLQPLFYRNCGFLKCGWFWVVVLFAPALFTVRITTDFNSSYTNKLLIRSLVLIIPVLLIWLLKDSRLQPLYGVVKIKRFKPYLLMLAAMLPLIQFASKQQDFMKVYPRFRGVDANPLIFELCYGFDFVSIEFFFRGFLILSMVNICGVKSIIPAACFYCTIHLGKPIFEAISSYFGGLLLGWVVYKTKSIAGGLIVHLGIAWIMEIAALFND